MPKKMQGVTLVADWDPKPGFNLGAKDIEGRQTYLGSLVWRHPRLEIREYDIPVPGPEQVLLEVKACGICGSDVHMAQADEDGYIYLVAREKEIIKVGGKRISPKEIEEVIVSVHSRT